MKSLLLLVLFVYPLAAQRLLPPPAPVQSERIQDKDKMLYVSSVAALLAATAADAGTSWGRIELNPVLARDGARFGWQAMAIKSACTGASLLVQRFVLRRNPAARRKLAWTNFVMAGTLGAVAARNSTLR
jgi:hypothetical protein